MLHVFFIWISLFFFRNPTLILKRNFKLIWFCVYLFILYFLLTLLLFSSFIHFWALRFWLDWCVDSITTCTIIGQGLRQYALTYTLFLDSIVWINAILAIKNLYRIINKWRLSFWFVPQAYYCLIAWIWTCVFEFDLAIKNLTRFSVDLFVLVACAAFETVGTFCQTRLLILNAVLASNGWALRAFHYW